MIEVLKMRLIDADAFAMWIDKNHYIDKVTGKCDARQNKVLGIVISAVKNPEICPTVDAEPVRHGRWDVYLDGKELMCSSCKITYFDEDQSGGTSYCPNCGAKMDGGDYDEHHH